MATTSTPSKPRRQAISQAQRACREIVSSVGAVLSGESDIDIGFLTAFRAASDQLLTAIGCIGEPLCDRLEYFREFVVGDDSTLEAYTLLGLPLHMDQCHAPRLAPSPTREWLRLFRDFSSRLDDLAHTPLPGARRNPNGGRKKSRKYAELAQRVSEIYQSAISSLQKNGLSPEDALQQIRAWSAARVLSEINDAYGHPYPLTGPQATNLKKEVTRSPAWRAMRDPEESLLLPSDSEDSLRMDASCAAENKLSLVRVGQN